MSPFLKTWTNSPFLKIWYQIFKNPVPDFRKSGLMQVAPGYAISCGSFDETIGRVVIIRDDSPMDGPADNAQLWESVLTPK